MGEITPPDIAQKNYERRMKVLLPDCSTEEERNRERLLAWVRLGYMLKLRHITYEERRKGVPETELTKMSDLWKEGRLTEKDVKIGLAMQNAHATTDSG